ncbi:hypothetical protein C9374_012438 [Naegleria lovaniensis]|uniref:Uncharacterized protein n=1 Tax=Naegleria lovaniensis TaxID=51637 RepID=A0AA88H357_NAELO|nr:uncharacterized protein C9374_012438 [Naegleria lovaniensis]KAG2392186.1 hypothetical protein C9374_012438 [Naegleria lovaniensis]
MSNSTFLMTMLMVCTVAIMVIPMAHSTLLSCTGNYLMDQNTATPYACTHRADSAHVFEMRSNGQLFFEGTMEELGWYNFASNDKIYMIYWLNLTETNPLKRTNTVNDIMQNTGGVIISFTLPATLGRSFHSFFRQQSTRALETRPLDTSVIPVSTTQTEASQRELKMSLAPRRVFNLPPKYRENSQKTWVVTASTPDQFKLRCEDPSDNRTAVVYYSFNTRLDKYLSFLSFFDPTGVTKIDMLDATGDDMNTLHLANGDVFQACFSC